MIEIVKPASMHLGRGMKSTEDFATVTRKCCNSQPLLTTIKFTNPPRRTSLVVVISNFNVEPAELLIAGDAFFCCYNFALFLLALTFAWNANGFSVC